MVLVEKITATIGLLVDDVDLIRLICTFFLILNSHLSLY